MDSTSVTRDYDVAVIGGGVSGAYTAWRLRTEGAASPVLKDLARKRSDRKLAIAIFEYSDRIGGRLYSMRLPGVPHLPIELGGMRFLNSHKRVNALVERYKLQYRPLPTMDPKLTNFFICGENISRRRTGTIRVSSHPSKWIAASGRARPATC